MGIIYGFYVDVREKNKDGKSVSSAWEPLKAPKDNPVMEGKSIYYNLVDWFRKSCMEQVNAGEFYPLDDYEPGDNVYDYVIPYEKLLAKSNEEWEEEVWTTKKGVKDYNEGDAWEPTPAEPDDPLGFAYYYKPYDGVVQPATTLVDRIIALMEWNELSFYSYDVRVRVRIYP